MLFAYIFGGIWCGIGLIFFLIGFFMHRNRKSKEQKCTAVTIGTVSDIEVRYSRSIGSGNTRSNHPVFEFNAGGQRYKLVSNVGTSMQKLTVGQSVTVYYDPEKPERYYVKEYTLGKTLGYIFLVTGSICFLIGVIAFVCCLKLS